MEAYLIIVACIVCILFLLVDLYLMAYYSHKDESNLSFVNIFCKLLIMLTLLQTQLQPLFLIIDVANSRTQNNDLTDFWLVLYFSLIVNLTVLKPIATSLYERDHDDPCWKSALWAFVQIFVSVGIFGAFIGIAWTFWGNVSIPIDFVAVDANNYSVQNSLQNAVISSGTFSFTTNLVCFLVAFFCILGYPILACCGACGLTVLPISLILDFVNRPKFRRTADAKKVADFLKVQTVRLLKQSERLRRQAVRLEDADGFFNKRKVNNKFQNQLKEIETELQSQKDYYDLFKMQLQMQSINPLVFWGKLILGILTAILSIIFWLQILFSQLLFPPQTGHGSMFLDRMFNFLQAQNANFVSIGFLMLIVFFMSFCIIKGSVFFSNSLPFITIHPIMQGKTWLNSFLFHLTLCSLSACSLIHLLSMTFPYYLRGGGIVILLDKLLNNLAVIGYLLKHKVFTYSFLAIGVLGILFVSYKMLYSSQTKGQLLRRIQAKRLKMFGKDGQNISLKFIQMTQLNQPTDKTMPASSKRLLKQK